MLRSNQGGSILSFVIIGGILTALLIGGAYFVQQRSAQSDEAPVATDQEPAPAPQAPTDEAPVEQEETPATEQPAAPVTPAPQPQPASPAAPTPDDEGPIAVKPQPTTAEQLPQTGPIETLSMLIGLGLLTSFTIAYVRSRRTQASL